MCRRTSLILAATLLTITPGSVRAQGGSLSEIVPRALLSGIRLDPSPPGTAGAPHTAHFDILNTQQYGDLTGDALAIYQSQVGLAADLNRSIASQLSTFPLGSSSGGFTYTLDPALGTFSRSSESFGPLFAERAYTVGRNNLSVGLNYMRRTYDTYEGRDLRDGEITLYFPHNDCCPGQTSTGDPVGDGTLTNPFFEGDVMQADLVLNLDTDVFSLFANYGVTDRFDIGVALPIVSVDLKSALNLTILRLATGTDVLVHSFDGRGLAAQTRTDEGSATGIGDLTLRGKYRFLDKPGGGLAAIADLRLPTGNEQDLLGTGATQFTMTLVGSTAVGRWAPHFNTGYTFSSGVSQEAEDAFVAAPPNEFSYTFGVDVAATPRLTFAGDLVGRTLFDVQRLVDADLTFRFTTTTGGPVQSTVLPAIATESDSLNLLLGSAGVKINLTKTLLFSFNMLFPLTDGGLRDRITPIVGFDYTFQR
jgi:Putative MetA-pathway of phenol degradation